MTTTSGYRFSQPQRVDSGLQQNVANTVRLGANLTGPFGEASRDRRTGREKHLGSRLFAFYQFPEPFPSDPRQLPGLSQLKDNCGKASSELAHFWITART